MEQMSTVEMISVTKSVLKALEITFDEEKLDEAEQNIRVLEEYMNQTYFESMTDQRMIAIRQKLIALNQGVLEEEGLNEEE